MPFEFEPLKDLLACPVSKADLVLEESYLVSCDPECRLQYPVQNEIPRLLEDDAEVLEESAWREIMTRHGRCETTGQPSEA